MNEKFTSYRITLLFILFVSLSFLPLYGQHKEITTLEPGAHAPDFNLPGVDGKMHSLSEYNSAPLLMIVFTANHCPTAQAYEDRIINIARKYKDRGLQVVAISPNSPEALSLSELGYSDMGDRLEEMKIRAKDINFPFPYLYDGDNQKVALAYGPTATPHVFLFDKNRILRYTGRIDDTENPYATPAQTDAVNAIEALLAGRDVPLAKTKTFGCSIKWAWKNEWVQKQREEWAKEPVELKLTDSAGIRDLIHQTGDKLRLINIWATWCGPCVMEFNSLIEINRMYRNRDFELVTISADLPSKRQKVLEFLKKHEASCTNYLFNSDNKYALVEAVDKNWQGAIPYSLLVSPEGKILKYYKGSIDPLKVKKDIIAVLGRYYADDK
ncbi:MAG TPA: redoxin family protein [Bacteroidales bacterium]|nr:redoxin family protein [Bacteroidales bacterium]